jgi:membrane peptidoglycan carboxypeptidase
MQVFKKLLLAIEDIAFSSHRGTDPQSLRHKLNSLAKTL